jgi:transcriptional regulator with XRE-family HTH domain
MTNEKVRKDFGSQLKHAREKAGLTQAEVAEKSGINISYYAKIERGEINTSIEKLHSIMKVLNIRSIDI